MVYPGIADMPEDSAESPGRGATVESRFEKLVDPGEEFPGKTSTLTWQVSDFWSMGAAEPELPAFQPYQGGPLSAGFGDPFWLFKSSIILIREANRRSGFPA
jgi:hypothetical protein